MVDLLLPWPAKELSPNARVHCAAKSKKARAARQLAWAETVNVGWKAPVSERIHLWVDFFPPTRRLPDDDNMLSRFKPYRDGIADALGIDDRVFVSHPLVRTEVRKGGVVRIRMTGDQDEHDR